MKINKKIEIFKKNEIIIYSIALMLVTAGYFNYSANEKNNTIETYADNLQQENNEVIVNTVSENDREDENIGDAKLVDSKNIVKEQTDYFVSAKLERDTNYADMLSMYTKLLEDNSVSETQKSSAMKEITKINETKNTISICENLLSTKGLNSSVIFANNESINVVVKADGELTKQKVAQIQNIISREFNCKIENIHITEK